MAARTATCIYCSTVFEPDKGQGDHVLPAALFGEFEGDLRFRGACLDCNHQLGKYEQELAQCSPLGYYRRMVNAKLRRGNGGSIQQGGAHGSPGPQFTAEFNGEALLVATAKSSATDIDPVDQLVVEDQAGEKHFIRLFDGMSSTAIKRKIDELGVSMVRSIACQCAAEKTDEIISVLGELYPSARYEEREELPSGMYQVAATIKFQFSTAYFQALAKIAFHYYLLHGRRGFTGSEPQFDAIRDFIRQGEQSQVDELFPKSDDRLQVPFGPQPDGGTVTSKGWIHVVSAVEDNGPIVVRLQFFVGPEALPPPTFVALGRCNSKILLPMGAFGHVFEYEPDRSGRFAGRRVPIATHRL